MDVNIMRETLRYEHQIARISEQVTIEGETTLPGSMRDAVTVLSVQAKAHLTGVQAATDRIGIRGRVGFQVLYTQGDLTRIRAIETTCDFAHSLMAAGVMPGMRTEASVQVKETNGISGSGRISLSAQLEIFAMAYEEAECSAVSGIRRTAGICTKDQSIELKSLDKLGEEKTLVRNEFDLPDRLGVKDVLTASGIARVTDITGGNGRVGVSGVIEMRVMHRPEKAGEALVATMHEAPFQVTIPAQLAEGAKPIAFAEVVDVMADSAESDRSRTMRVEAEVGVKLFDQRERQIEILEDLYSTEGTILEPKFEKIQVHTAENYGIVRESVRIQAMLPADAPPIETMLAAMAHPVSASFENAGRRTNAEGIMELTLLYLPVDSDIPYAVKEREPYSMTFPIETENGAQIQMEVVECSIGPATSDRVELRCMLNLQALIHRIEDLQIVTDIEEKPEIKREHGFVLIWPAPGESRWETARRLRVPQESLRPAGASALMAFKR